MRRYGLVGLLYALRNRHAQILSHALALLRVRNERRFEGHLRPPGECRVANDSIISNPIQV